jgi:hypothetical protein
VAKEVTFWVKTSDLKNQGFKTQAAIANEQRNRRWKSISGRPHLQQVFSMCFEYLESVSSVGKALRMILQMKAFTLGIISLDFQTSLRIFLICSETGAGEGVPVPLDPASKLYRQIWHCVFHLRLASSIKYLDDQREGS